MISGALRATNSAALFSLSEVACDGATGAASQSEHTHTYFCHHCLLAGLLRQFVPVSVVERLII